MMYVAIGVDGHQYGIGEYDDIAAAAEMAFKHIDDEIVAIHLVLDGVIQG